MAGIKISNLLQIDNVESGDFLPVARGGSETYKTPASQFVIAGKNEGSGAGQFYINEALVSGKRTMRFRTLSAVGDGISLTTVGNTVVINLTGTTPTVTKHVSNGSQTDFSVSIPAPISTNPANYRVDIDGIVQEPITDYTVVGSNISFTEAPPLSSKVVIVSNGIIRSYDVTPTLNSITSGMYIDQSITTSKIADLAITTSKIALSSIGTAQLSAGAVANVHLLSGIDASKLTTGTLPADRIGLSAITTARINNGAVTAAKLDGSQIGSAPVYGIRAWVSFNGRLSQDLAGTYTRTSNVVTVSAPGHGLTFGHTVQLNFTGGSPNNAPNDTYLVTSASGDSFTVNTLSTGTITGGTATLRRRAILASGNVASITYIAQGYYALNFLTPMPDSNFAVTFGGRVRSGYRQTPFEDSILDTYDRYSFLFKTTNTTPTDTDFTRTDCFVIR